MLPRSRYLKGSGSLRVEPRADRLRRVDARLQRDLGDTGQVFEIHHVADHEYLRVTRQRAVGPDLDAPGSI